MENKEWYKSKTVWINMIALVAMFIQNFTGFVIDAQTQAAILIIINLVLRATTGGAVSFGGKSFAKQNCNIQATYTSIYMRGLKV